VGESSGSARILTIYSELELEMEAGCLSLRMLLVATGAVLQVLALRSGGAVDRRRGMIQHAGAA
jgi:hypothetical protein